MSRLPLHLAILSCIMLPVSGTRAATPLPPAPTAGPVTERVVLVARHGIRSPTHPIAELDAHTHRHWQTWPVAPGALTDHGRRDLALMGAALGRYYRQAGVLPTQGCRAGAVAVWSDATDQRTLQTGDIMGHALTPGCPVVTDSLPAGSHDPVFNDLHAYDTPALQQTIMTDLSTALTHDRDGRPADVRLAQATAQAVVQPNGCAMGTPCFTGPDRATWHKNAPRLSGGLSQSADVAEDMLLEYAQGMPDDAIGWGQPDIRHMIDTLMPAHDHASRLMRRLPALAFPRGHVLAAMIMELVAGNAVHEPDGDMIAAGTPVVLFAGHDSTLDMLAAIFGLDWSFADMPDPTGPDTTLGFETWHMPDGQQRVRAVIFHQGLDALRTEQAITAQPDILPLPACQSKTDGSCTLADFTRVFTSRLSAYRRD
ncbi:phosphoanhydride phosphohydrolase [Komagataeibacter oboediens DSM 11826]|nr:histidine-type phosphatase [Komagataeibacter oboediens]MCK9819573.1 phosphoanhydride phosphohydrolase [Komagataeibacter oboediens]GBR35407.1 phosphoanhydride phosphohydrolase [Komagataeibacter oboediens DSM 11826]